MRCKSVLRNLGFLGRISLLFLARRYRGAAGVFLTPLHAGLAVTVMLAPLIAGTFGGVPLQAPVTTAVSIPFMVILILSVYGIGKNVADHIKWSVSEQMKPYSGVHF